MKNLQGSSARLSLRGAKKSAKKGANRRYTYFTVFLDFQAYLIKELSVSPSVTEVDHDRRCSAGMSATFRNFPQSLERFVDLWICSRSIL